MRRRVGGLLMCGAALIAGILLWWLWPREEADVRAVWQGKPQFTQRGQ